MPRKVASDAPPPTPVTELFEDRNIECLKLPSKDYGISMLLMGSTRSGKSTFMNYLYETIFKHHITTLHSASAHGDIYKPLLKSCAIADRYLPELIHETHIINKKTGNEYEFLHIIDDVVDKKNDPEIKKLFCTYRNQRVSGIYCGQSLTIFNNVVRGNINYVFLGYLNNDANVEAVIKSFLISYFPTKMRLGDKIKAYRELTKDHHWIVIDSIHGDVFRTKLLHSQII